MKRKITGFLAAVLFALAGAGGLTAAVWAETGSTGPTRSIEPETNCTDDGDINCAEDVNGADEANDPDACSGFIDDNNDCIEGHTTPGGSFTEVADAKDGSTGLRMGQNLLLAGNDVKSSASMNGLLFVAGNRVGLTTDSDYGFVAGNIVNISAWTNKDLFAAGNVVTLEKEANIGRDAYVAGSTVIVETDLDGDLSVMADTVELHDVQIEGNLNIEANKILIKGSTVIEGVTNYNSNAIVENLDKLDCDSIEVYQQKQNVAENMVMVWSGKFLSMLMLFLCTIIILAIFRHLYSRLVAASDMTQFGNNIGLGVAVLIAMPLLGLIALCTILLAPLGISILALWMIAIYLAQGFAGVWLGHLLVTHALKSKGGFVIDALVGILILGVLSLVPFVGVATGFLGLVLGLGLIMQCLRRKPILGQNQPQSDQTDRTDSDRSVSKELESGEKQSAKRRERSQNAGKRNAKIEPKSRRDKKGREE